MKKHSFFYKENEITYYINNNNEIFVDLEHFYQVFSKSFPSILTFNQWIEIDKNRQTSCIEFLSIYIGLSEDQLIIDYNDKQLIHFDLAYKYICNNQINNEEISSCYFKNWYLIQNSL